LEEKGIDTYIIVSALIINNILISV